MEKTPEKSPRSAESKSFPSEQIGKIWNAMESIVEPFGWDPSRFLSDEEIQTFDEARDSINSINSVFGLPLYFENYDENFVPSLRTLEIKSEDLDKVRKELAKIEMVLSWDITGDSEDEHILQEARQSAAFLRSVL